MFSILQLTKRQMNGFQTESPNSIFLAEAKFYKLTNFSVDSTEANIFPVTTVISPVVTRARFLQREARAPTATVILLIRSQRKRLGTRD